MQINGLSQLHGAQQISGPHANRYAQPAQTPSTFAASDELSISSAGDIASRLSEIPDIRQDRVQALRAAIADGSYDSGDKLSVALDRLLDEIG